MTFESGALLFGTLLLVMAFSGTFIRGLPITTSVVYLGVGLVLGPLGTGVLNLDPMKHVHWLHRASEVAVVLSLFTVGLKLRLPRGHERWRAPLCLASVSMIITVGLVAAFAVVVLDWSLGAAVLLGGVLAPTDPVLASDVQLAKPGDRDRVRLTLTGEGGMNDGTAFPFVMLGLGLLGVHDLGTWGWRWWAVDVVWAIVGGVGIGAALGWATGKTLIYLHQRWRRALGLDEYLLLGLIGVAYGLALWAHAYGFLAVFAAGIALRSVERNAGENDPESTLHSLSDEAKREEIARDPARASAYLAGAILTFNEQLERIGEVVLVIVVGVMLAVAWTPDALWLALVLFVFVRPVAALPVLLTGKFSRVQFACVGWFGIRGVGSLYYLGYALTHGVEPGEGFPLMQVTLSVIALSIVVHGISVTPALARYEKGKRDDGAGGGVGDTPGAER